MRNDGRKLDQLRPVKIIPHVMAYAEGSVEIQFGQTRVLCSASYDPTVPKWLAGTGQGWVSAEYGMLPRSTHDRLNREKSMNSGRTQEISRLIGRSLRAAVDLSKLGERQILIDCDVIQADGGTRTAAITGGYVALALALKYLKDQGSISTIPLKNYVAAVSVGFKSGQAYLDLNYEEDSSIGTDMNIIMTHKNEFIELQGTAETQTFTQSDLNLMLEVAQKGLRELFGEQEKLIGSFHNLNH